MRDRPLEREEWLSLARRQARELSAAREEPVLPFRWPVLPGGASRRALPFFGLPLAWGLAAVALVLIGGVTGTYAFVRHLQREEAVARQAAPTVTVVEKAPAALPAPTDPIARPASEERASQPEPPAPPPSPRKRPAPRPNAFAPAPVHTPESGKPPARGEITFTGEEMPGGGELILVNPPPRMGPLWSPEEYKKNGRLGSRP